MVSITAPELSDHEESAKRRQILEGARAVFLGQGFDAASMGDIAREAKVSKGTLYVYFDSKEELFQTIVEEECRAQAEQVFALGKRFYAMGPASGMARVARYIEDQVKAGVLAVPDCELAAAQFLDSCKSTTFQPLLLNARERASEERIKYVVATAVRTFLAAYRR